MPVFSRNGKNFLFVHIPKAAGTTIEKVFMNNDYKTSYRTSAGTAVNKVTVCTPQHYHGNILQNIFNMHSFDFIFTVTRNPYERIRSEYAMRHKSAEKYQADVVTRWMKNKFSTYNTNPFVNDNHIRPQSEFLVPNIKIFKLEDSVESIFDFLNNNFDAGVSYNSGSKHMVSKRINGFSSRDVELNDESIKLINDFYNNDFELFGYDKIAL
jgi:hypothetical protein